MRSRLARASAHRSRLPIACRARGLPPGLRGASLAAPSRSPASSRASPRHAVDRHVSRRYPKRSMSEAVLSRALIVASWARHSLRPSPMIAVTSAWNSGVARNLEHVPRQVHRQSILTPQRAEPGGVVRRVRLHAIVAELFADRGGANGAVEGLDETRPGTGGSRCQRDFAYGVTRSRRRGGRTRGRRGDGVLSVSAPGPPRQRVERGSVKPSAGARRAARCRLARCCGPGIVSLQTRDGHIRTQDRCSWRRLRWRPLCAGPRAAGPHGHTHRGQSRQPRELPRLPTDAGGGRGRERGSDRHHHSTSPAARPRGSTSARSRVSTSRRTPSPSALASCPARR